MEKEKMNLFALKEARKCSEGYKLSQLRLNYNAGVPSVGRVVLDAFEEVKQVFVSGGSKEEAIGKAREKLEATFPLKKGDLKASLSLEVEKHMVRMEQLADHLWSLPGEREINQWFEVEVDGVFYSDKADIVLTAEGFKRAIMIENGVNPYSSRARLVENKPTYNLGCVLLSAAGYQQCEVWYFKSKDEKNNYFPPFEEKPEKNICSAVIAPEDAKAYLSSLYNNAVVDAAVCGDCKDCRHSCVCKLKPYREEGRSLDSGRQGLETKMTFTEAQLRGINHMAGPMALIAVPGAGKTKVLVERTLELQKRGVPLRNVLLITFTKKAVGELRERLGKALGAEPEAMIQTFNGFGYDILRENASLLGRKIKIADDNDIKNIICQILDKKAAEGKYIEGMSYSGANLDFGIVSRLAGWYKDIYAKGKEAFITRMGEKVKDMDGVMEFYDAFLKVFRGNNFITYDEQISLTNKLFEEHPEVVEKLAERYKYIMVDEYQDTSAEQAKMVYAIAKHHNNIMVVGDDDQAVYGWRGGDSKFLLEFKDDFPEAEMVVMNDNFRSNEKVLAAADAVINANSHRLGKQLTGHRDAKFAPVYYRADARKIAELVPYILKSYRAGDIAILARTNKRFDEVESALEGICKTTSPKDYIIEDAVFETLYDIFNLYNNLGDDVSLYRLLSRLGVTEFPKKSGTTTLYQALRDAEPGFNLDRLDMHCMDSYRKEELSVLMSAGKKIVLCLKQLQYYRCMEDAFTNIANAFGFPADHKVVGHLLEVCDEHDFSSIKELYAYMEDMVLFHSTVRVGYEASADAVNLLTGHDSKGKEFPVVIIYGAEDFSEGTEEANCLLYVAMTRAKNTLLMIESPFAEHSVVEIGSLREHIVCA